MWYQLFKHVLFVPYVKVFCRPQVDGLENLPASGGVLLAANHLGAGDTFLVPASLPRQMVFPAKAELFRGDQGIRSRAVAWFLRAVGQVPLDRTGGRASAEGLEPVLQALREGHVVGIFPEGTRSPDGRLYKGKTGVARIALASGAPVVPVGLVDTALRRGPLGVRYMRGARIVIGEPMCLQAPSGNETDQQTLRRLTNQVMAQVQRLSGQEYVDVYGASVKHGDLVGSEVSERVLPFPGAPIDEEVQTGA